MLALRSESVMNYSGMNYNVNINLDEIIVSPYCRVSTDKSDQANSLANQISYYSELVKRRENWRLGEIYYDEGISGTSTQKRKGFNRMIQDALAGKVRLIITKEVTRFARKLMNTKVQTLFMPA